MREWQGSALAKRSQWRYVDKAHRMYSWSTLPQASILHNGAFQFFEGFSHRFYGSAKSSHTCERLLLAWNTTNAEWTRCSFLICYVFANSITGGGVRMTVCTCQVAHDFLLVTGVRS